jgi:DNA-binding CsgD family transcriptional regulator
MKVTNFLEKLYSTGINHTSNYEDTKRLMLFNQTILLYFCMVSPYIVIFSFMNLSFLSFLLVPFLLIYILCFYLNQYSKIYLSKIIFFLTTITGVIVYTILIGLDSGIQNGLFTTLITSLVIFNFSERKLRLCGAFISIITFFLLTNIYSFTSTFIVVPDQFIKTLYFSLQLNVFFTIFHTLKLYFNLSHDMSKEFSKTLVNYGLTPRELEVVSQASKSNSNKEIGQTLFISETTVKTHLKHIFKKLKIKNRVELMMILMKN